MWYSTSVTNAYFGAKVKLFIAIPLFLDKY